VSDPDPAPIPVKVIAGNPTPEELAAVSVVLAAQLEAIRRTPSAEAPAPSRWVRSDGKLRERWDADARHWRSVQR